jgi:hypothetical protein
VTIAPVFQLVMIPSKVVLTIAADEDSTMAASRACDWLSPPYEEIGCQGLTFPPITLLAYGSR